MCYVLYRQRGYTMLTETSDCCTVTGTYQQQHECTQLYPKRSVMTLIKTLASILLPLISTATAAGQHELVTSANALFERREFAEAETLLRKALADSPSDAPALVLLGRLTATVGRVDEAKGLYRRALDASPDNAPAHHAMAKVLAFQKRWDEAKESFESSLRLDANNAEGWLGMGRVAMTIGNEVDAEKYYERSMKLDPTNALLYFDMGVLACKTGKVEAAGQAFARAEELNPRLDLNVVAQMFTAYGMLDHARNAHRRVLQKEPDNPVHLLAYGELCEAQKDEEEAIHAYDQALRVRPTMGKAHLKKALLLTGTGTTNQAALHACGLNADEAKHHLREALRSGDDGVVSPAKEALAWCEMEEREMRDWRRIVSDDLASSSAPPRARARIGQAWADNGGEERQNFTPSWVEDLGGFLSIPEVDIVDENHFMEAFVNRSRPAVIKNFQSEFAPKESWSWKALSERFERSTVRVSLSETGRFDGPESGDLWGLSTEDEVLVRPPTTSMAFEDFVQLLKAKDIQETFYLEYLAVHQYLGEQLQKMIPIPLAVARSGLELLLTNFWVGKGGTLAVLHYDDYENLLCQIRGTKELVIFPPKDLRNLYYTGRRKGKLQYDFPGKWRRDTLDGSNKVIFSSSVRLDDPDFDRHPRLNKCRPYRVTLQEGDVLYMPAFWHHEVRSFPDDDEGNVAVNFWFRNVTSFAEEERHVLGIGVEDDHGYQSSEL